MKRTFTTLSELNFEDMFYFVSDKKRTVYKCGHEAKERRFQKFVFKMIYFLAKDAKGEYHISTKSPRQGSIAVVKIEI